MRAPSEEKEIQLVAFGGAALSDRRHESAIVATILVLVGVRLVCAALAPLSFDESLYWLWSKHIAGGYYDHPPVNPILIRLGTTLFGNTEFGVRVFGVLLAVPASWAVWRSGAILFNEKVGATAALYFNLTLVMAAGSVLATPDNAVVVASAFLLLTLVKLYETGRGAWWLAIGVAFGIGMLSKYTTIFFAVSILAWLLLVPALRKWLFTPWPWLSGVIALVVFSPTLIWNAEHDWASFLYHFHRRLVIHELSLQYVVEFFLSQIGMATPPIFVLGCMGLARFFKGQGGSHAARVLINAMVLPIMIYFFWHAFHERVEGNWPEPIYVAFVIGAAMAGEGFRWTGGWARIQVWSKRLAVPLGLGVAGFVYLQAAFGIIPLGPIDPTARALGAGWQELGIQLDEVRLRLGSPVVLTTNYGLTGWLAFYLPSHPPVEQINGRIRYVDAPEPDPALFRGPIMYVCEEQCNEIQLRQRFAVVELVASFLRTRHGLPIQKYVVYRLSGPIGSPLDPP
jgi:4-amino-4-deoxy-L-arabinose transferase-like glycosyltransferase